MKHIALRITLQDAVVLSEREATGGGHRTLRHVPGSVLLGVAASRLYRRLSPEDAFIAFHSGRVRFLSGMPSWDGRSPAWPMPISLHEPKVVKAVQVDNACFGLPEGQQRVALREGYIAAAASDIGNGTAVKVGPRTLKVTKTAINAVSGSAAEGQLFTYECLAPGQVFIAGVEADPNVPAALLDAVVEVLLGSVRLGRSRSAEFGRARVERIEEVAPAAQGQRASEGAVWLLSDLAALDSNGQPTVQPTAADLGLPGEIDWSRSFVRVRRYSPWNAHRGGYDAERLLLQAGSVLWIAGASSGLVSEQRSLGRHTEAGLGRVWVAPPLLAAPRLELHKAEEVDGQHHTPSVSASKVPPTPLLAWFMARGKGTGIADLREQTIATLELGIESLYRRVAQELAPPEGVPVGASSSQWRDVARLAETATASGSETRAKVLVDRLFSASSNERLAKRPGWSDPFWESGQGVVNGSGKRVALANGVHDLLVAAKLGDALPDVLSLLARRMSRNPVVDVRTENRKASHSVLPEVRR